MFVFPGNTSQGCRSLFGVLTGVVPGFVSLRLELNAHVRVSWCNTVWFASLPPKV